MRLIDSTVIGLRYLLVIKWTLIVSFFRLATEILKSISPANTPFPIENFWGHFSSPQ
jgi:hypothetical protein